jgi:hypothetical protein
MVMASPIESGASSGTAAQSARLCSRCGSPINRRRRNNRQDDTLCATCDQRDRRAAYFRSYYEEHRDRILDKNRRWARDNKTRIVQLRQARRVRDVDVTAVSRACIDCQAPVTRALRCRKCYIRFRYANDMAYRERRLATTRRWLEKRASVGQPAGRRSSSRTAQALAN